MASKYRIKNWSSFQHYHTGKRAKTAPEWIKLYRRDTLDDIEFHKLSGDDAKKLILLWLVASENGGELPAVDQMAFRLRTTEDDLKSALPRLSHWLEETPASRLLADCYQAASTEKKRREKKREEEKTEEERRGETAPTGPDENLSGDDDLERDIQGEPGTGASATPPLPAEPNARSLERYEATRKGLLAATEADNPNTRRSR